MVGVAVAAAGVSVGNIAVRENRDSEEDESQREKARPHDWREQERCQFFDGADDSVHNVLPWKSVALRLPALRAVSVQIQPEGASKSVPTDSPFRAAPTWAAEVNTTGIP